MRIRYGWELALAALLVIEIVAFGAINPRMLDLNMLLFSTSDFICIGIVALPLTMGSIFRLVRPSASAPLHWAYCFKVVCRCRWRFS